MIARRVPVVEGLVAEPVRERVDAEGRLLDDEEAQDAGVDEPAEPVAPGEAGDGAGEEERHAEGDGDVVLVLVHDEGVVVEVCDVDAPDRFRVLLEHHPAHV